MSTFTEHVRNTLSEYDGEWYWWLGSKGEDFYSPSVGPPLIAIPFALPGQPLPWDTEGTIEKAFEEMETP